jgi:hypothetical protein
MRVFSGASHAAHDHGEDALSRLYRRFMVPLVHYPRRGTTFLVATVLALSVFIVGGFAGFKLVILARRRLTTRASVGRREYAGRYDAGADCQSDTRDGQYFKGLAPEVINYQSYIGIVFSYNFNGLVRHYFCDRGD